MGAGASILGNVTVGKGAIVGAGSVVTPDVEPMCVVAGNPARVIRRIPEQPDPDDLERHRTAMSMIEESLGRVGAGPDLTTISRCPDVNACDNMPDHDIDRAQKGVSKHTDCVSSAAEPCVSDDDVTPANLDSLLLCSTSRISMKSSLQ